MREGYSTYLNALENSALHRSDMQVFGVFEASSKKELQALVEPLGLKVRGFKSSSQVTLASRELRGLPDAPAYLRLGRSNRSPQSWRLYLLWAGKRFEIDGELDGKIRSILTRDGSELIYSNPTSTQAG